MSDPVSNDELDWLIWHALRDQDGHPTNNSDLVTTAGGKWRRIDSRMQAMRKAGRIRWHPQPLPHQRPAHVPRPRLGGDRLPRCRRTGGRGV